jgi:hypothetical protein
VEFANSNVAIADRLFRDLVESPPNGIKGVITDNGCDHGKAADRNE